MKEPLVSVVMPVYNGGMFLVDAVASIIEQSFTDWELICVNDGSDDGSQTLLDWFTEQDGRIRVIHQSNAGIVKALNTGCAAARGPLLARMDCDDIAMPERLAVQCQHMRDHADCVVVGGTILEIDADSDPLGISRLPESHEGIVENLLHRRTGHFHPTTMIRAEAFRAVGGYRSKYQWVEDHDLWLRLARRGRLSNMATVVLGYRQHAGSVCWRRSAQQRELMNELLGEAYRDRGLPVPEGVLMHQAFQRTPAGPGKWARAAARGGYTRSVFKQLSRLQKSDLPRSYKLRMTVEALLRLGWGSVKRLISQGHTPLPRYAAWHHRWQEAAPKTVSPTQAA